MTGGDASSWEERTLRRIHEESVMASKMRAVLAVGMLLATGGAVASGINGINNGMPNRISMNVTVPKQTQGATFGEKVSGGLHAAGNAVAQGASLTITAECGQAACVVTLPDGSGYRADLQRRRVEVLKSNKAGDSDANAAREISQGASLVGGALPGAGIVSAAVSSVGNLAGGGGGAATASYAATGRTAGRGMEALASTSATPGVIDVIDPLADGDYTLTLIVDKVVEKATSGLKDTLKTQVRTMAPQRVEIVLGFGVEAGVLKTRHDTAKNSIANIR
ncbi:hypothetical protein [Thermomonas sp. HDW16]|uniref:hypothetical protein n=1 Tax=Thermomonas sp. HDW16 TaxID=2714945 RepID=UPI001408701D|nr:hypothetical protein [Thermomonas sp. HDW16]QIL19242.1 hypothetical protein G7079_03530 [Thermomonas sp. HDW16]